MFVLTTSSDKSIVISVLIITIASLAVPGLTVRAPIGPSVYSTVSKLPSQYAYYLPKSDSYARKYKVYKPKHEFSEQITNKNYYPSVDHRPIIDPLYSGYRQDALAAPQQPFGFVSNYRNENGDDQIVRATPAPQRPGQAPRPTSPTPIKPSFQINSIERNYLAQLEFERARKMKPHYGQVYGKNEALRVVSPPHFSSRPARQKYSVLRNQISALKQQQRNHFSVDEDEHPAAQRFRAYNKEPENYGEYYPYPPTNTHSSAYMPEYLEKPNQFEQIKDYIQPVQHVNLHQQGPHHFQHIKIHHTNPNSYSQYKQADEEPNHYEPLQIIPDRYERLKAHHDPPRPSRYEQLKQEQDEHFQNVKPNFDNFFDEFDDHEKHTLKNFETEGYDKNSAESRRYEDSREIMLQKNYKNTPHRNFKPYGLRATHPSESAEEDIEPEFVPYKMLASVRRTESIKHKSKKDEPEVKERLVEMGGHIHYTEQGYDDEQYDHGQENKFAKFKTATEEKPVKREKRSFNRKFPYYYSSPDKSSSLRYVETSPDKLPNSQRTLYQLKSKKCKNIDFDHSTVNDKDTDFKTKKRLVGLGDDIDCYKEMLFGVDPFENPLFKEDLVTDSFTKIVRRRKRSSDADEGDADVKPVYEMEAKPKKLRRRKLTIKRLTNTTTNTLPQTETTKLREPLKSKESTKANNFGSIKDPAPFSRSNVPAVPLNEKVINKIKENPSIPYTEYLHYPELDSSEVLIFDISHFIPKLFTIPNIETDPYVPSKRLSNSSSNSTNDTLTNNKNKINNKNNDSNINNHHNNKNNNENHQTSNKNNINKTSTLSERENNKNTTDDEDDDDDDSDDAEDKMEKNKRSPYYEDSHTPEFSQKKYVSVEDEVDKFFSSR